MNAIGQSRHARVPGEDRLWPTLLEKSGQFRKPALIEHAFDDSFLSHADIIRALRRLPEFSHSTPKVRVYVDGGERPEFEALVRRKPPAEGENIEQWAGAMFGGRKFGIIVNNVEALDDDLARKLALSFHPASPLVRKFPGGTDMVFFIGNYGYTPFGVHRDGEKECILHFHLGPGTKRFYLWEPKVYERETGSFNPCFEPDRISASARQLTLHPRSVFFMPEGLFHIGRNDEFSVDMTLGFSRISQRDLSLRCYTEAGRYLFRKPARGSATREVVEGFPASSPLEPEYANYEVARWMELARKSYLLEARSNCGFVTPPAIRDVPELPLDRAKVMLVKPFRIESLAIDRKRLSVFSRRYRTVVENAPGMVRLLRILNTGRPFVLGRLEAIVGEDRLAAAGDLMCRMVACRALEVISEDVSKAPAIE